MSHRHPPAATTSTVELQQVQDINRRLAAAGRRDITAEAIGVAGTVSASARSFPVDLFGTAAPPSQALRPSAALRYLTAEGSPEFPYVLGHFAASPAGAQDDARLVIELHSAGLRRLSARLGLRHSWGTDAALAGTVIR